MAQALWEVRKTRSLAEVVKFVSKIQVYVIVDQDTTAAWIRDNFPDIHYVRTRYPNEITIENANAIEATVLIPDDAVGREIHVILEVTDDGKPVLYSYRRVIFKVK